MVMHSTSDRALPATPWQEWRALLVACHDYAVISGWRFVNADFMNLSQKRHEKDGLNAARERGLREMRQARETPPHNDVDRARPDTLDNRSVLQRLFHLVDDDHRLGRRH